MTRSILWGLPGFIAYYLLQTVKPRRAKSGWDFVLEVGLLSLSCYVISYALEGPIVHHGARLCPDIAAWAKLQWPSEFSLTLALGLFPVAEIVGVALGLTNRFRANLLGFYHRLVTRERNFQFSDVFFAMCDELLGEMALITLKSGKVYVGVFIAATQDPNESKRFVRFVPVLSGYRDKDELTVTYTTFYEPAPDTGRRTLLVSADEVSTLAHFDEARFHYFVTTGDVTLDIRAAPKPGTETESPAT